MFLLEQQHEAIADSYGLSIKSTNLFMKFFQCLPYTICDVHLERNILIAILEVWRRSVLEAIWRSGSISDLLRQGHECISHSRHYFFGGEVKSSVQVMNQPQAENLYNTETITTTLGPLTNATLWYEGSGITLLDCRLYPSPSTANSGISTVKRG